MTCQHVLAHGATILSLGLLLLVVSGPAAVGSDQLQHSTADVHKPLPSLPQPLVTFQSKALSVEPTASALLATSLYSNFSPYERPHGVFDQRQDHSDEPSTTGSSSSSSRFSWLSPSRSFKRLQRSSSSGSFRRSSASSSSAPTVGDRPTPFVDHPDQIDRLVMIGDSLTDTGNFYRDSGEAYPNRKVYIDKEGQYKGRFTNGKVWADYAEDLLRTAKPSWTIDPLAYGGATSGPGVASGSNKVHGQMRETVNGDQQLAKFKTKYDPLAASRSVVVVWIGSNDLLHSVKANVKKTLYSDGLLGPTLYNVKNLIDQLLDYGCARVVVVNIPELSHLPAVAIRRAIMKDKLGLTHGSSGDLLISEPMDIPPAVPIPIQKTRQRKTFSDWNELPSRGSQASLLTDNLVESPESMPDLSSTDSVASSQSSSGRQWAKKLFRKPSRAVLGKVVDGFFDLAVGRLTASIQRYSQLLQEWVASHQHRDRLLFVDINPKFREVIEGATNKDPCVTTDDKAGPSLGFGSTQLVKCASPENHIFMDEIHPTSSVHEKLAGFILAQIRPDDFAAMA